MWAVSRLENWKQMMSIHVIGESDIDNFLLLQRIRDFVVVDALYKSTFTYFFDNLRQKTKVGDGSI